MLVIAEISELSTTISKNNLVHYMLPTTSVVNSTPLPFVQINMPLMRSQKRMGWIDFVKAMLLITFQTSTLS